METLKQHLERCYDDDYRSLSNEIRNIALEFAMIALKTMIKGDKTRIPEKIADYVYLLRLVADAIDRIGKGS